MTWQYVSDVDGEFVKDYRNAFDEAASDPDLDPEDPTPPTDP